MTPSRRWLFLSAAAAVILLLAAWLWLRSSGPYRGATGHAGLLLITVDGLRCDRAGACAGRSGLTPQIDRLAARGVSFQSAFTASAATRPAHATLLTGLYPPAHGVRDREADRLGAPPVTLAEALANQGFRTAAVVGSDELSGASGLDQGFEVYDDGQGIRRPAPAVTQAAVARIRQAKQDRRRSFLWVQYADPAWPLPPPEPFRGQHPRSPYDGMVAGVDAEIGKLIAALEAEALGDRTLVIVAGSHGHSLGASGEALHGSLLHEPVVRVPLVMALPPHLPEGLRVAGIARTVDLLPTVLELLRVPAPVGTAAQGASLWALMNGAEAPSDRAAYFEARDGPGNGWSAAAGDCDASGMLAAYGRATLRGPAVLEGDGGPLAPAGPGEAEERRRRLAELLSTIEPHARLDDAHGLPDPFDVPGDLARSERLRAAAAAGHHEVVAREAAEALTAPPDRPALRLLLARSLAALGRHEEAASHYLTILVGDPDHRAALSGLADSLARAGRVEEARAAYQKALSVDADDPRHLTGLAKLAFARGQGGEAGRLFTSALRSRPDHLPAIFAMAVLLESAGKLDESAAFYARAAEVDPLALQGPMGWAWILHRQGRHEQAVDVLSRAREQAPGMAPLESALGDVYLAMGRASDARAAYERALAADAAAAPALYGMGRVEMMAGAAPRAADLIARAVELKPGQALWREDLARALAASGRYGAAAEQMELFLQSGRAPADRLEALRRETAQWRLKGR